MGATRGMRRERLEGTLWTGSGETCNPLVEGSNPSWLASILNGVIGRPLSNRAITSLLDSAGAPRRGGSQRSL